ncbi:hypothetical protein BJX61DRAFT_533164 [Aspergillus egyptiacus]|nr:hypothetical protein BJX61DRAFT_533164 [Aspergillus egyptiacus]
MSQSTANKIIVGVDYGTTFTEAFAGACYVSSKAIDLSDIVLISSWRGPSGDTETVFKAPSRIAYPDENPRITNTCWGYQVEPGMTAYSWTKLLLGKGKPLTKYDDPALETASQTGILKLLPGKEPVDVVADYLSKVYAHILKNLSKNMTEEALRITPIEFWFTVPAIWSDRARSATMTAAHRAGFGDSPSRPHDKIFLISEPEAAAIVALRKYTTHGIADVVKAGDGVLVCDYGGGTVCGSTAIDRNFYSLMSERFGAAFDSFPAKRKCSGSEFMKRFEVIKRDFGNYESESTFELPLNMHVVDAGPMHFDEEERLVIMTNDDLCKVFDPVVDQIVQLVRDQLEEAKNQAGEDIINRIIPVGGFGDSEYLRKAMTSAFASTGQITITVPDCPQARIIQGAALRGLEGLRSFSKRSRRHYGFSMGIPFRAGIDDEANSYYDDFTVARGEKYTDNYAQCIHLFFSRDESTSLVRKVNLYACENVIAPERKDDEGWKPGVYRVGTVTVEFSGVNLRSLKSRLVKGGKRVYCLDYDLRVNLGALEGVLKFEAISRGRAIGEATINFSDDKFY